MRVLAPLLALSLLVVACGGLTLPTTPGAVLTLEVVLTAEGPVPLSLFAPADDTTVTVAEVEVRGKTVPDGIVTLNEVIVVADEKGEFSAVVPLDEGPNAIEIIVSDLDGNETDLMLTVTYDTGD